MSNHHHHEFQQHPHDGPLLSQSSRDQRRNNIVSESDIEAALKGIQDCFDEYCNRVLERDATSEYPTNRVDPPTPRTNQNENDDPQQQTSSVSVSGIQKALQLKLATSVKESFCQHLERAVQPVSDNAYQVFLHRHSASDSDHNHGEKKAPAVTTAANPFDGMGQAGIEGLQHDYDEESLLDQEALHRARDLRLQVRRAALHVGALRKSVLEQAVALARRQIRCWKLEQGISDGDDKNAGPENSDHVVAITAKNDQLQELEQSLRTLMQNLQQANEEYPDKMDQLQEAIQTIERGLVESSRLEKDNHVLSSKDAGNTDCNGSDRGTQAGGEGYTEGNKMPLSMKFSSFARS